MNYSVQTILKNKNIHFYKKITFNVRSRFKKIEYFYDILSNGDVKETLCHNEKNPAVIIYSGNKVTKLEYWYKGKLHRKYSPAIISFFDNKISSEEWYNDGIKLDEKEIDSIKKTIDRKTKIMRLKNKIKK